MKMKVLKAIMIGLFLFLLLRLFIVNTFSNANDGDNKKQGSIVELYSKEGENPVFKVKDNFAKKVEKENEEARLKVFKENQRKKYMALYPDMYVEGVKPIILLEEKKMAYLTFDDGPSYNTTKILEILKEYDVKATFFILGSTITEEGKACLKTMAEEGHAIGIHTYSHKPEDIYSSVEAFLNDFYLSYQLIYDTTGVKPNIFRFPWGSVNTYNKKIRSELIAEMERRGFTYYDWNVDSKDSVGNPNEYKITRNIAKDLHKYNNPIILLHDASVNKRTVKTLPLVIEKIKEDGFDFDTLDHREPFQF
ncbi:MAG: polysaccharide deacetylase family protein [Anaerocolumna sp.]